MGYPQAHRRMYPLPPVKISTHVLMCTYSRDRDTDASREDESGDGEEPGTVGEDTGQATSGWGQHTTGWGATDTPGWGRQEPATGWGRQGPEVTGHLEPQHSPSEKRKGGPVQKETNLLFEVCTDFPASVLSAANQGPSTPEKPILISLSRILPHSF